MSRRRICLVLLLAVGVGAALLLGAPGAQAKGVLGTGIGPNVGPNLNPLPSIGELLNGVVNGVFGALLSALTPSFLKHADIHTLEWLIALPNVADTAIWPTVGRLEANMVWVAGAILPTTLIIATTRDTALSLSFRAHPGNALLRVIGAVFWLVLYRFAVANAVAFVNVLTHTMLSWSIVAQGLHRTVLVMFGGSVILGAGGAFLALLGLVALVFAVCLFALKVLLLMVLAVLFVAGPLLIALTPLPTVGYLARGWLLALVGICLIPVGWCIIFATAGRDQPRRDQPRRRCAHRQSGGGGLRGARHLLHRPEVAADGARARPQQPRRPRRTAGGAIRWRERRERWGARRQGSARTDGAPGGHARRGPRHRARRGSARERRVADWLVSRREEHDHILRVPPRPVRLPSGRLEPDLARPPLLGASPRRGMPSATPRRGCVTRGGPPASHPPKGAPRERKPDRGGARAAGGQAGARETGRAAVVNLAPHGAARPHLPAPGPRARVTQGARRSCRQPLPIA